MMTFVFAMFLLVAQVIRSDKLSDVFANGYPELANGFVTHNRSQIVTKLNSNATINGNKIIGYAKQIGPTWCTITKDTVLFINIASCRMINAKSKTDRYIIVSEIKLNQCPNTFNQETNQLNVDMVKGLIEKELSLANLNYDLETLLSADKRHYLTEHKQEFCDAINLDFEHNASDMVKQVFNELQRNETVKISLTRWISNLPEQILPDLLAKIRHHQYTELDIANLLSLKLSGVTTGSLEEFTKDISNTEDTKREEELLENARDGNVFFKFYKKDAKYVLPPRSGDLAESMLKLFPKLNNAENNLILIPYNTGGHWITLEVSINADSSCNIKHIDSLQGAYKQKANEFITMFRKVKQLASFTFTNSGTITPRIQPNSTDCGAYSVENICDIMAGNKLPCTEKINRRQSLDIKTNHYNLLLQNNTDFEY
ncbi:MAG: hypothetical protein H6845_01520 [Alphaproteobacteria bacterium]|nr:MAG: hypothetical protein H6845_01520 [Alphaproteobacteria bacterium]